MILDFVIVNLNVIALSIWVIFFVLVVIRFFSPVWVKNISFFKLAIITFSLRIFYNIFVTYGQYHVWATGSVVTKTFINTPLPKETPIPLFMEWLRPILLENNLGYFLYYVWGRFWLYVFILFLVSIVLYILLKIWRDYRGGFSKDGPMIILILALISGWPGILVFIPLGFILAVFYLIFFYFRGKNNVEIEPVFFVASLIALVFSNIILGFL